MEATVSTGDVRPLNNASEPISVVIADDDLNPRDACYTSVTPASEPEVVAAHDSGVAVTGCPSEEEERNKNDQTINSSQCRPGLDARRQSTSNRSFSSSHAPLLRPGADLSKSYLPRLTDPGAPPAREVHMSTAAKCVAPPPAPGKKYLSGSRRRVGEHRTEGDRGREASARSSMSIVLTSSQRPLNDILTRSNVRHYCSASDRRSYCGDYAGAQPNGRVGTNIPQAKYTAVVSRGVGGRDGLESVGCNSRWSSCGSSSKNHRIVSGLGPGASHGGGYEGGDLLMSVLNTTLRENIDANIGRLRRSSGQLGQERLKALDDTKKCLDVMIALAKYSGLK